MPDISMCIGEVCAKKEECYRFKATPSTFHQSYFMTPPMNEDGSCDEFREIWENKPDGA